MLTDGGIHSQAHGLHERTCSPHENAFDRGSFASGGDPAQGSRAVIVERILDSMVRAIDRGDKVEIRGFGSFRTRQRQARVARHPKTGARVEVPAKRIPFLKPSKELRELVEKI
jgi:integration host factor subunit beta